MGLFINKHDHPEVFKNSGKIAEPNQNFVKKGHLSEIIDEQQKINVSFVNTLNELKSRYLEQESLQTTHWNDVSGQLHELKATSHHHQKFEEQMMEWLKILEEKNNTLQSANQQLTLQLNEQLKLQKDLSQKFSNQEEFQSGVLMRLDKQDAVTEKISRQLNHIRSILFERTNHLAEKIEEGYKLTSSYVYNLMTGTDKPFTFYMLNKKEKKENNSG